MASSASTLASPLNSGVPAEVVLPQLEPVDEDDEFEDFRESTWGADEKKKEDDLVEWAADWDDDTVETDFDLALKKELEAFAQESAAAAAAAAAATPAAAAMADTEIK